jgi:tetratricopeptide (TPR) repeat protein
MLTLPATAVRGETEENRRVQLVVAFPVDLMRHAKRLHEQCKYREAQQVGLLAGQTAIAEFGLAPPMAELMAVEAGFEFDMYHYDDARKLLQSSLALDRRQSDFSTDEKRKVMLNLAFVMTKQGQFPEATHVVGELVQVLANKGHDDAAFQFLQARLSLATSDHARAQASLARCKELIGDSDASLLTAAMAEEANLYYETHEHERATSSLSEAIAISQKANGTTHIRTIEYIVRLTDWLLTEAKFAEAARVLSQVPEDHKTNLGSDHPLAMQIAQFSSMIGTRKSSNQAARQQKLEEPE